MPTLADNRYGKRGVRLVKVMRQPDRCDLKEITVNIFMAGDFESCYRAGDNSRILSTDTMKNTVYALARGSSLDSIEDFGLELADHLLANNAQAEKVRVELEETLWSRMGVEGQPHPAAFQQRGPEKRVATIDGSRAKTVVSAGIDHWVVLKVSDSEFGGFIRDRFTTLMETKDRLLGTEIRAEWRYAERRLPFNELWGCALETLTKAFAEHKSRSVQHTLYAMGQSVLSDIAELDEIYLCLPNKHCLLVDLSPFNLDNPNEIFVPVDEPHGFIEARITR